MFRTLLLSAALAASAAAADPGWAPIDAPAGVDRGAEAVAIDLESGRLAVGGERGVALGPLGGPLERVLTRGPVHDLVFEADGTLLAATEVGLFRIESADSVLFERIATGEAARSVRALATGAGVVIAATAAGVFERAQGDAPLPWLRVPGLPFGEASRVALTQSEGGLEVWAAIEGALWTASEEQGARRVSLPSAAQGETGPIDLVATDAGELIAVLHRSLAVRSAAGEWRVERLVLPPGAQPLRIAAEPDGRLWLATDAGLLVADGPAGPWRRTGPPAGGAAVAALAGGRDELVVATAQGLLRHEAVSDEIALGAQPTPPDPPARASRAQDPPIAEVQRRALRYVALDPSRMEQLWEGAGRRAWAPQVSVRGDWGRDLDRAYGFDETFSSGETHWLYDRDRSRAQAYAMGVALSWDLGDAVFNLDRIDVSREARLVTQLRDDVLDEINQLYFERQRVLASLEAPPSDTPAEVLVLRADELASGLDAWTGGWFSEQVAKPSRGPALPEQDSKP